MKTKIEHAPGLKITLSNGEQKVCQSVSQAARFYADQMTQQWWNSKGEALCLGQYISANQYTIYEEARYRRAYAVFAKILPKQPYGKMPNVFKGNQ